MKGTSEDLPLKKRMLTTNLGWDARVVLGRGRHRLENKIDNENIYIYILIAKYENMSKTMKWKYILCRLELIDVGQSN